MLTNIEHFKPVSEKNQSKQTKIEIDDKHAVLSSVHLFCENQISCSQWRKKF